MPGADVVRGVLAARGPLTGAALHAVVGGGLFGLWKTCLASEGVVVRSVARRYVRLDRGVEGFARLSPSILREFVTYSVVGLADDEEAVAAAAARVAAHTRAVSQVKRRTAERFTAEVLGAFAARGGDPSGFCVLLAGDVVHGMAHTVPRRESSTGGPVDGSDLDLVVLAGDAVPQADVEALDALVGQRKWLYLRNPALREEVDYVVKRFSRLVEQAGFATFADRVACKVFDEAVPLAGDLRLHEAGRALLVERGVVARLRELEARAIEQRAAREATLLTVPGEELPAEGRQQFYTDDEAAEFEHR